MNKSEKIDELALAMSEVQARVRVVEFDAMANATKTRSYKYATLGANIEVLKEVLPELGLSFVQFPISEGWYIGVDTTVMHKSGQWLSERVLFPMKADAFNPAQEAGAVITYARRYALAAVFGLYAEEDVDASTEPTTTLEKKDKKATATRADGRPYTPEVLVQKLFVTADAVVPASPSQMGLTAMLLKNYCERDEDKRHAIQNYLVGNPSLKEADQKMVHAVLRWLNAEKDSGGEYVIPDIVLLELKQVEVLVSKSI